MAGSKLVSVPKTKGDNLRRATISKLKGNALARIAKIINNSKLSAWNVASGMPAKIAMGIKKHMPINIPKHTV